MNYKIFAIGLPLAVQLLLNLASFAPANPMQRDETSSTPSLESMLYAPAFNVPADRDLTIVIELANRTSDDVSLQLLPPRQGTPKAQLIGSKGLFCEIAIQAAKTRPQVGNAPASISPIAVPASGQRLLKVVIPRNLVAKGTLTFSSTIYKDGEQLTKSSPLVLMAE